MPRRKDKDSRPADSAATSKAEEDAAQSTVVGIGASAGGLAALKAFFAAVPAEVRALADDLLITVTRFFRDPEVFEKLEKEVIPALFEDRSAEDVVRVWSVGCATGEEAYSLAILLMEEAGRRESPPRIHVVASDLHDQSLERARNGFYPGDIATDIGAERLKRFFTEEAGGYRIQHDVRELVVFSPHNLLGDPPFSRIDLIACRNFLIYLDRDVQPDVVDLFHYALRDGGFLVLGSSETVDSRDLLQVLDKKNCIYRRRNVPAREPRLPFFPVSTVARGGSRAGGGVGASPVGYAELHQRIIERHGPPAHS
jgi:two-component system, chemotaxis family, CheB/CheR fusion protein